MEDKKKIKPRYLSLREAGEYCGGRTAEAMRMMARRGYIRAIKVGKLTFIDIKDIDDAMLNGKLEIPA